MTRLLIIAAIVLLGVLAFGYFAGDSAAMMDDDLMRGVYLGILALMLASGVIASQRSASAALRNIAIWLAITLVLVTAWLYKDDAGNWGARVMAALMPGSGMSVETADGFQEVVLYKSRNGHFEADAEINGVDIDMLVDTGATGIALTWEDAERLGLKPDGLNFSSSVMTANGPAKIAMVRLDRVVLGAIRRNGLSAGIAERGKLDQSLLGMNFLGTLSAVTIAGSELRLRD